MPTLFIANTSNKVNEFTFRLPGNSKLHLRSIPAGKQIEIIRDAQQEDVDYIVEQHQIYGLVHASQIKKVCAFSGMLYSIDKPVDSVAMDFAMEQNDDELIKLGQKLRSESAVAMDSQLSENISNSRERIGRQKELTMEIIEQPEERTTKKRMLQEKITVDRG